MMPTLLNGQAPVPPPSYHRAQARHQRALHIDALTLVTSLHLLALCRLAVHLAHRRCPPPLPAGKGGANRTYSEESLLLIALLRTLGGCPTKICTTGSRRGPLWPWPAACHEVARGSCVSPVRRSSGNEGMPLVLLCPKPSSC